MKKTIFLAFFIALLNIMATAAFSEETLLDIDIESTGFGGPVLKYTQIDNVPCQMIGGRGGWIINHW